MAEVRMETQVDPLVVMILTIQMAMVDRVDRLMVVAITVTPEEEGLLGAMTNTILMEMEDKVDPSMVVEITGILMAAHLGATIHIIQEAMVDKEAHSMEEVMIATMAEEEEDIIAQVLIWAQSQQY